MNDDQNENITGENQVIEGVENSEESCESLKQEFTQEKEKFLRIIADYENKIKRSHIDAQNMIKSSIGYLVKDLTAVINDLKSASKLANEETKSGLLLVEKNLLKTLNKYGIEEIIPQIGDKFDSAIHQAISSKESDLPAGSVIEILQHGFQYHSQVITPAIVIVSE